MSDLPACIENALPVRLIPALHETSREAMAVSTFLSCLKTVRALAQPVFAQFGIPIGQRTRIECWSEVRLRRQVGDRQLRPDGLICVYHGAKRWMALIEAKTGTAELDRNQVEAYLRLARENGVDALITLSNQFAARPDHTPLTINRNLTRSADLFHMPWKTVLTNSQLALAGEAPMTEHERFLLTEFAHYLAQPKSGTSDFTAMNEEWTELIHAVQHGAPVGRKTKPVRQTVLAWHQELHDVALSLSGPVGTLVTVKVPRPAAHDAEPWREADAAHFERTHCLRGTLQIPHAEPIHLTADLSRRTIAAHVRLRAPADKKRPSARLNWLVKQLRGIDDRDITIRLISKGRGGNPVIPLSKLRADPKMATSLCGGVAPGHFEVAVTQHLGTAFARRRKFLARLDTLVLDFYDRVGQNTQSWVAPPPAFRAPLGPPCAKPAKPGVAPPSHAPLSGRCSVASSDIPPFLRRHPDHAVPLQKS